MAPSNKQTIPITVRIATSDDVPGISVVGAYVFAMMFGYSMPEEDLQAYLREAYSLEATAREISNPRKDMFVATTKRSHIGERLIDGLYLPAGDNDDDEIVLGFLLLTRGTTEPCLEQYPNLIELQRYYVHTAFHGSGIGRKLSNEAESLARAQGFENMWLGVWEENWTSHKVYEKLGYKQVGFHDFKMGDCIQRDFVMVKSI